MTAVAEKFRSLATDNAPGQEVRQNTSDLHRIAKGDKIPGSKVDFSHGDVDAFTPTPGSFEEFSEGVTAGARQAYTEYRGAAEIRELMAERLARFTGHPVQSDLGVMLTSGTQGALFLAVAATVAAGDKVAIVQPDYFANRKIVQFLGGEILPVKMDYLKNEKEAGLDLSQLQAAFEAGAKVFLFSNPNNPTGAVYSEREIGEIADLARRFGVTVIADQLYSRLRYEGQDYTHIRACNLPDDQVVTIMGPSKTESLSGYRLGVAFGSPTVLDRMEKLQAIVCLRTAGYNQAVLRTWFDEPPGWMEERTLRHQAIRDRLLGIFRQGGLVTRSPGAGSYLFPTLPKLSVTLNDFVQLLRHQADVIVTPGTEFGPYDQSIRLNFSQDAAAAAQAAARIVELADRYKA